MSKVRDLLNKKIGRWTVIKRLERDFRNRPQWLCKCECGNERILISAYLNSGRSKSCGCLKRDTLNSPRKNKKHGLTKSKIYQCWVDMRRRCNDPRNASYKRYGALGIKVHPRWGDFRNFLADLGLPPSEKHTLDRIDPWGMYEPGNCRWATPKEQGNNRTNNHLVSINGETKTLRQWLELKNLPENSFRHRLKKGLTIVEALTKPINKKFSSRFRK